MPESRSFFLPTFGPSEQEAAYAELARWAGRSLPTGPRIYSITYTHDGEEWIATVGEQLRGHTIADPRARAKMRRFSRPVGDAATVLAIFPGEPYMVVTDNRLNPNVRSKWENPFMAGRPRSVTYFAEESSSA
jgi:hypothetical protein